ncbi:MAG TPA: phosphotransferase [Trebonia sp.]
MGAGVPGTLVGAGRSADVYDLGNGRVLRRYRDRRPPERVAAEAEAEVMACARRFGVPVPEVLEVSGPDIVMERVDGPTMVEAIGRRPWTGGAQVRSLARLHELVHRVPASGLALPPFGPAGDRDGDVLLHRDLHPQNVILAAGGPMIIDWESAARGPAAADIAMTWAIITFSDIPGSRLEAVVLAGVRALLTRSFLRAAGPLDETWRTLAVQRRLAEPHVLPSEAARMRRWSTASPSPASGSPASGSAATGSPDASG